MGVGQLETQLLDIFKRFYGVHVETFIIPLVGSQVQLANRLTNWTIEH